MVKLLPVVESVAVGGTAVTGCQGVVASPVGVNAPEVNNGPLNEESGVCVTSGGGMVHCLTNTGTSAKSDVGVVVFVMQGGVVVLEMVIIFLAAAKGGRDPTQSSIFTQNEHRIQDGDVNYIEGPRVTRNGAKQVATTNLNLHF